MAEFDWSRFRLGIYIKASPEAVYRAWATAAGLVAWFPNAARYESRSGKSRGKPGLAKTGDLYTKYFFYGGGIESTGRVIAARKPSLFKITFAPNGEITVRVSKVGKYSLVELVQGKIATSAKARIDSHMGCRTGWTFYLTNLKSVLEGGPDLRELDRERAKQTFLVNM